MRKTIMVLVLSLTSLFVVGCKKESAPQGSATTAGPSTPTAPTNTAPANTVPANHAPAHTAPGSHDDWCGEHQVPESMCTRCNPKLAAAFKATGDWCAEHGLPKSHCRLCDPNLKLERPPEKRAQ